MLALHLLQICLVYINTLMIQRVLTEPDWTQRTLPDDLRALTPLIYAHVTPYGTFRLDMRQLRRLTGRRRQCVVRIVWKIVGQLDLPNIGDEFAFQWLRSPAARLEPSKAQARAND